MSVVQIKRDDHLLVGCKGGTDLDKAISAATIFCKEFMVKSVVVSHNDMLIQVTSRGALELKGE